MTPGKPKIKAPDQNREPAHPKTDLRPEAEPLICLPSLLYVILGGRFLNVSLDNMSLRSYTTEKIVSGSTYFGSNN